MLHRFGTVCSDRRRAEITDSPPTRLAGAIMVVTGIGSHVSEVDVPTTVTRPAIVPGDHAVDMGLVLHHVCEAFAGHPDLDRYLRVMQATGVTTRYWARPAEQVLAPEPVGQRTSAYLAATVDLGARAARAALDQAALAPSDIDVLVTVSLTGWATPGVDVRLIDALGLPETVRRLPATQLGCAGGLWGLVRATELARVYPGARVLLVVADPPSLYLHARDDDLSSMIWRALLGDCAAACVITDSSGPGLRLGASLEYTIAGSADYITDVLDSTGWHMRSRPQMLTAVTTAAPAIRHWLKGLTPSWYVTHTGGPRILQDVASELDIKPEMLRLAWESLATIGNVGGGSILDVLHRSWTDPATRRDGTGLLLAVGPGMTAIACQATWAP